MTEPHHAHHSGAWQPDAAPPEPERAALRRLADAMRQTIDLLMETAAPEAQLLAAASMVEELNAKLEAGPRGRPLWGFAEASTSGNPMGFYDNSPLSGPSNPLAPPLTMSTDGEFVHASAEFGIAYEGPPGHVHGGFVAAAFDEVLGMAQSLTGNPGMTGQLSVRYRKPTPLYRRLEFRGKVDRVDGRKIYTSATLHAGETLCAEAEGLFISVGHMRFRELGEVAERPGG
jgi:acyl-coenzyme A thioesterase PaaI-like protein